MEVNMSTRGAIGFRLNGKNKVTYNHFDSYPASLGQNVLQFCRETDDWDKVKEQVEAIRLVQRLSVPTNQDIELCKEFADLGVSNSSLHDWYCLLRKAQGDLAAYLKVGVMIDSEQFLQDGLFCEWHYIINLDDMVLEIYKSGSMIGHCPLSKLPRSMPSSGKIRSVEINGG